MRVALVEFCIVDFLRWLTTLRISHSSTIKNERCLCKLVTHHPIFFNLFISTSPSQHAIALLLSPRSSELKSQVVSTFKSWDAYWRQSRRKKLLKYQWFVPSFVITHSINQIEVFFLLLFHSSAATAKHDSGWCRFYWKSTFGNQINLSFLRFRWTHLGNDSNSSVERCDERRFHSNRRRKSSILIKCKIFNRKMAKQSFFFLSWNSDTKLK